MERNGVGGDTAVCKVGGWAERTRGGARMERLGTVVAIAMNETLRVATPHAHATELTRNGVARVSALGGRERGGGRAVETSARSVTCDR